MVRHMSLLKTLSPGYIDIELRFIYMCSIAARYGDIHRYKYLGGTVNRYYYFLKSIIRYFRSFFTWSYTFVKELKMNDLPGSSNLGTQLVSKKKQHNCSCLEAFRVRAKQQGSLKPAKVDRLVFLAKYL